MQHYLIMSRIYSHIWLCVQLLLVHHQQYDHKAYLHTICLTVQVI